MRRGVSSRRLDAPALRYNAGMTKSCLIACLVAVVGCSCRLATGDVGEGESEAETSEGEGEGEPLPDGFLVDVASDAFDVNFDGNCFSVDANGCTLREAVAEIQGSGSSLAAILPAGQVFLEMPLYLVSGSVNIVGRGIDESTIIGNEVERHFEVQGASLTLRNLTLRGGGGAYGGSTMLIGGTLATTRVRFEDNHADEDGGALVVDLLSSAELDETTFLRNNVAIGGGGAVAVYNESRLTIRASSFLDNAAAFGGAVSIRDVNADQLQ